MNGARLALGRMGEDRAAAYLEGLGWRVLARGWRTSSGELDLVARDGETVVFVEVKTRRSSAFGTPEEAVGPAKRARIIRAAMMWLASRAEPEAPARFDVIAIEGPTLRHIRGAFDADGL